MNRSNIEVPVVYVAPGNSCNEMTVHAYLLEPAALNSAQNSLVGSSSLGVMQ